VQKQAPVNVNTAGVSELTSLRGIGPALAGRIVEHRKEHGPFARVEDLLEVKGIGPKLLASIRDRVTVGPSSPAQR
jgi:competence protein ComEA